MKGALTYFKERALNRRSYCPALGFTFLPNYTEITLHSEACNPINVCACFSSDVDERHSNAACLRSCFVFLVLATAQKKKKEKIFFGCERSDLHDRRSIILMERRRQAKQCVSCRGVSPIRYQTYFICIQHPTHTPPRSLITLAAPIQLVGAQAQWLGACAYKQKKQTFLKGSQP